MLLTLSSLSFAQIMDTNHPSSTEEASTPNEVTFRDIRINDEEFTIYTIKDRKNYLEPKYYCSDGITPYIEPIKTIDIINLASVAALNLQSINVMMNGTNDKEMHLGMGYIAGSGTSAFLQVVLPKKMKSRKLISFLGGAGMAFLAGVAKEVKDSDGSGNVEFLDAFATAGGGAIGAFQVSLTDFKRIFTSKKSKNKEKMFEKGLTLDELELIVREKNNQNAQSTL
jgi:hypothetical protein